MERISKKSTPIVITPDYWKKTNIADALGKITGENNSSIQKAEAFRSPRRGVVAPGVAKVFHFLWGALNGRR